MKSYRIHQTSLPASQRGVVLIASLVILLVLSFLAVQGSQTATLEEKMAGNFRSQKVAFEAAEAALADAEAFIDSLTEAPLATAAGTNGVFTYGSADIEQDSFWNPSSAGVNTLANANLYALDSDPLYVIEQRRRESGSTGSAEIGSISRSSVAGEIVSYRITARGTGSLDRSVVLLQSHYERTY